MSVRVAYNDDRSSLWVSFPYDPILIDRLKRGVKVGRRWHPEVKWWEVFPVMLPQLVMTFPEADYIGEKLQEEVAKVKRSLLGRNVSNALQPNMIKVELYPFQKAGVYALEQLDTAFLADDPGLGKTIQAIAWVKKRGLKNALCIVPAAVKLNWKREIERACPGEEVLLLDGDNSTTVSKAGRLFGAPRWVIASYAVVAVKGKRPKNGFDKGKDKRCKGCGAVLGSRSGGIHEAICTYRFDALILDEAHFIKNNAAQRTKGTVYIAKGIQYKLALSGTPLTNRPVELFPVLRALDRINENDYWTFVNKFCNPQKKWIGRGRAVLDTNGASNLGELKEYLSGFMIRRLKSEVLTELPDKTFTDIPVEYDDEAAYRRAEQDYIDSLDDGSILGALQRLRVVSANEKLKSASEIMETIAEEGTKTLVFCCFLEPLKALHAKFKSSVLLTGEEPPTSRQRHIDHFNSNKFCLFALCSTTATGIGVNMTAAEKVLFLDLPWTPAQMTQAIDRCHRIGQTKKVEVVSLIGSRKGALTVDERMKAVLATKQKIFDGAIPTTQDMYRALKESYLRDRS